MAEELHVLFGGGQVGHPLSRILLGCGKRVRIVKRSAGGLPDGVELVRGDATDPNFCVEAARGASTAYHCIIPILGDRDSGGDSGIGANLIQRGERGDSPC
jgi:nucleoside-diphosphate-sugar epimerase